MNKVVNVVSSVLLAATFALPIAGSAALNTAAQTKSRHAVHQLIGVWKGNGPNNVSAKQHTVLELRRDHTYTKTFRATVDAVDYGGTHSGRWTARGMIVDLSGDGNYIGYSQDLRSMRKVKYGIRARLANCCARLNQSPQDRRKLLALTVMRTVRQIRHFN
jgi:hypothetical protein